MIEYRILGIAGRTFFIWELSICTENYSDRARRDMEGWGCASKFRPYEEFIHTGLDKTTTLPLCRVHWRGEWGCWLPELT